MDEKKIKSIELKVNNLLQLRNNCINIVVILLGGIIGLVLSEFSFVKLILIIIGILFAVFIFVAANIADKDIDTLIKELKQ